MTACRLIHICFHWPARIHFFNGYFLNKLSQKFITNNSVNRFQVCIIWMIFIPVVVEKVSKSIKAILYYFYSFFSSAFFNLSVRLFVGRLRNNPVRTAKWQAWRRPELHHVDGYVFQHSSTTPSNKSLKTNNGKSK